MQSAVLRVTKPKRKRNRLVIFFLLPVVAVVWLVGWSLYWVGRKKEAKPILKTKARDSPVSLIASAAIEEEPLEISE